MKPCNTNVIFLKKERKNKSSAVELSDGIISIAISIYKMDIKSFQIILICITLARNCKRQQEIVYTEHGLHW